MIPQVKRDQYKSIRIYNTLKMKVFFHVHIPSSVRTRVKINKTSLVPKH